MDKFKRSNFSSSEVNSFTLQEKRLTVQLTTFFT